MLKTESPAPIRTAIENLLNLNFGDFLAKFFHSQIEEEIALEYPLTHQLFFAPMKDQFSTVAFYSLFFQNGLVSHLIHLIVAKTKSAPNLPSRTHEQVLSHLEKLLTQLKSHQSFRWDSISLRVTTYLSSIKKKASLADIRNFSLSLWFEIYGMHHFLKNLPDADADCGIAEFLKEKKDDKNCDARFIQNASIVSLLEFKNKNTSQGNIEHNDFKTSLNDFIQNYKFPLGELLKLFHPELFESTPGFMMAYPMHYEEPIDDLSAVEAEINAKFPKDFSSDEKCNRVKKRHEKVILLKMVDLYSQNLTNIKPFVQLPTNTDEAYVIQSAVRKIGSKKFWCPLISKALGQLSKAKKDEEASGRVISKCYIYIFWGRPESLYPSVFAEDFREKILSASLEQLNNAVDAKLSCCLTNYHPQMKNLVELQLIHNFDFN